MTGFPGISDTMKTAIVALLSALAGALLALLLAGGRTSGSAADSDMARIDELVERVAALEQRAAVASGSRAVTAGADEVTAGAANAPAGETAGQATGMRDQRAEEMWQRRERTVSTTLLDAGWTDAEINALATLQESAALDAEQRQYDAMREALANDPERASMWRNRQSIMRDALGDEKFEQYLEANGRPSAAEVRNVLAGSTGESAGLHPGDAIRRYGNVRVYDERDLMFAMLDGKPGEPVTLEIERDGTIFYVTVPRGPLGISRASRLGRDF